MGYETPYPEPLTEIAKLSFATTWAWKLINFFQKKHNGVRMRRRMVVLFFRGTSLDIFGFKNNFLADFLLFSTLHCRLSFSKLILDLGIFNVYWIHANFWPPTSWSIYQQTNMADWTPTVRKKTKTTLQLRFILIGELSVALENSNLCYTLVQDM